MFHYRGMAYWEANYDPNFYNLSLDDYVKSSRCVPATPAHALPCPCISLPPLLPCLPFACLLLSAHRLHCQSTPSSPLLKLRPAPV